ncbi:MAG TPA: acyl carrier protein [Micromonosporaceae bacterium]|jgi:acyl carrier protein
MPVLAEAHKEQIVSLVSEILEIDTEAMSDTSRFKEDHGADSLRAIEILAALERGFNIEIDQAELSRMVNLQGIYDVVAEAHARRG